MRLENSHAAWGTEGFSAIFREELKRNAAILPLQKCLSVTSVALDSAIEVMLICAHEEKGRIFVKAGIFYEGIVAGCSCADDPTPVEVQAEYCEIKVEIGEYGEASVEILEEVDGKQH